MAVGQLDTPCVSVTTRCMVTLVTGTVGGLRILALDTVFALDKPREEA